MNKAIFYSWSKLKNRVNLLEFWCHFVSFAYIFFKTNENDFEIAHKTCSITCWVLNLKLMPIHMLMVLCENCHICIQSVNFCSAKVIEIVRVDRCGPTQVNVTYFWKFISSICVLTIMFDKNTLWLMIFV